MTIATQPAVQVVGDLATVTFDRFDLDAYRVFLQTKALPEKQVSFDWELDRYTLTTPARFADRLGLELPVREMSAVLVAGHLFDYQRWVLNMALDAKRFALWLDTGLGKTAVYLEWVRQVQALTDGRVLILAPLQVIPQVLEEQARFYPDNDRVIHLTTRDALVDWCKSEVSDQPTVGITNYEKFIPGTISELRYLSGLVADESSVLRTGGGVIKWNLIKSARGIEYKLSCTATPAPNEAMEYASQAAFLEKLRTEGDILWTYFQRDKRGEWSVKPHAQEAFYCFMASWSVYLRDPARFGFNDILSSLPEPVTLEERIGLSEEQRAVMQELLIAHNYGLFVDDRIPVTLRIKLAQVARGFLYETVDGRRSVRRIPADKPPRVAEIIRNEVAAGRQVLVWTSFDEEGEIIQQALSKDALFTAILDGKQKPEERLRILNAFRAGDVYALISKPQLIGYGLNLQFVEAMIFSGLDDSFERRYQAVRRAYRFGQTKTVRVYVPYVPELEGMLFDNVAEKEQRFLQEVAAQEAQYRRALGMGTQS